MEAAAFIVSRAAIPQQAMRQDVNKCLGFSRNTLIIRRHRKFTMLVWEEEVKPSTLHAASLSRSQPSAPRTAPSTSVSTSPRATPEVAPAHVEATPPAALQAVQASISQASISQASISQAAAEPVALQAAAAQPAVSQPAV